VFWGGFLPKNSADIDNTPIPSLYALSLLQSEFHVDAWSLLLLLCQRDVLLFGGCIRLFLVLFRRVCACVRHIMPERRTQLFAFVGEELRETELMGGLRPSSNSSANPGRCPHGPEFTVGQLQVVRGRG